MKNGHNYNDTIITMVDFYHIIKHYCYRKNVTVNCNIFNLLIFYKSKIKKIQEKNGILCFIQYKK